MCLLCSKQAILPKVKLESHAFAALRMLGIAAGSGPRLCFAPRTQ